MRLTYERMCDPMRQMSLGIRRAIRLFKRRFPVFWLNLFSDNWIMKRPKRRRTFLSFLFR
jgi:hypothetical protein